MYFFQPAVISLPPTVLVLLVKSPLVDRYDVSSVRIVNVGAAATKREVEVEFRRRLHNCVITQGKSEIVSFDLFTLSFSLQPYLLPSLLPSSFLPSFLHSFLPSSLPSSLFKRIYVNAIQHKDLCLYCFYHRACWQRRTLCCISAVRSKCVRTVKGKTGAGIR